MDNLSQYKLGKHEPKNDQRTFRLARYLGTNLPPAPASADWTKLPHAWEMLGNDTVGDCTIASPAHMEMCWMNQCKTAFRPTANAVLHDYSAITGYNPKTGANDDGAAVLDVMNYWRKTGIVGRKILAFAKTGLSDQERIKFAIANFVGVNIGLALPVSASRQRIWDVGPGLNGDYAPGSWGLHCVCVLAYDEQTVTCVTWGKLKVMTWRFFTAYADECYAIISNDYFINGKAPDGFDMKTLQADLAAL